MPTILWVNRLIKVNLFNVFVFVYTYELFSVMLMMLYQNKLELRL